MLLALCISCILIVPATVGAHITSVEVTPSNPTVDDVVTIEVSGYYEDSCWEVGPYQCGMLQGFTINLATIGYDSWQPGWVCLPVIVPYSFACEYGPLEAGHYVVDFIEEHWSMRDPSSSARTVEFDVIMPAGIEATVDIHPGTLNLGSGGKFVTCYIEPPEGYLAEDIDVSTVQLEHAVNALPLPTGIGDYDLDGVTDRMVKFPRDEVIGLVDDSKAVHGCGSASDLEGSGRSHGEYIEVTVSGEMTDGTPFAGADCIRVTRPESYMDAGPDREVSYTSRGPSVVISFDLDVAGVVSMQVYDAAGRLVRTLVNGPKAAGSHEVIWDTTTDGGRQVSAGVYFIRQQHRGKAHIEKAVVLK
jgi:hypothetical protein